MGAVVLKTTRELRTALEAFGREFEEESITAMVKAARFGATAVIRTHVQTSPKIDASRTFRNSWVVQRLDDGAALSNSAAHSYFVEVGRRPGRMPPFEPIREWLFQKRLWKRPKKLKVPKRITKRWLMGIRIREAEETAIEEFVDKIRWKIAKRGTRGRWVLKRTVPAIAKRAHRELKRAHKATTRKPPRK